MTPMKALVVMAAVTIIATLAAVGFGSTLLIQHVRTPAVPKGSLAIATCPSGLKIAYRATDAPPRWPCPAQAPGAGDPVPGRVPAPPK